jgi:hypothetical protein
LILRFKDFSFLAMNPQERRQGINKRYTRQVGEADPDDQRSAAPDDHMSGKGDKPKSTKRDRGKEEKGGKGNAAGAGRARERTILWAAMGGVATALTVVISTCQYHQSVREFESTQRARLVVARMEFTPWDWAGPGTRGVDIYFTNNGGSTAEGFTFDTISVLATSLLETPPIAPTTEHRRSRGRIGAGQTFQTGALLPEQRTPDEISAVEGGRQYLYVIGSAVYSDEFCEQRVLRFCKRYRPDAPPIFCENGNEELTCENPR